MELKTEFTFAPAAEQPRRRRGGVCERHRPDAAAAFAPAPEERRGGGV